MENLMIKYFEKCRERDQMIARGENTLCIDTDIYNIAYYLKFIA